MTNTRAELAKFIMGMNYGELKSARFARHTAKHRAAYIAETYEEARAMSSSTRPVR